MIEFAGMKLYSVDDIAEALDMDKLTIRRYFRIGKISGRKVGRNWFASEESLHSFLNPTTTKKETE